MRLAAGAALWGIAVFLREPLEATMPTHALAQLPILVAAGYLLAPTARNAIPHSMAVSGLLITVFTAAIWMLPRSVDASLSSDIVEIAKFTTIPLLVGLPLGWSWPRLSGLLRSFVWANLVSMLLSLGWLYLAAPVRVCNFYAASEQKTVGLLYLAVAAGVVAYWLPRLFLDGAIQRDVQPMN